MQLKGFKPCYKWNAFNTHEDCRNNPGLYGFKPCYKWNAFNTEEKKYWEDLVKEVLNLVISGMPSILKNSSFSSKTFIGVLNLVISGMPSIPLILLEY